MTLMTIKAFASECGLTYEAIRVKIRKGEIRCYRDTNLIDADEYDYIIKYNQNRINATK